MVIDEHVVQIKLKRKCHLQVVWGSTHNFFFLIPIAYNLEYKT